ncbi:MAG TPA: sigma 54-interacting transcriptional regulator [Parafilimonas sp.]|nr:sigma 54-interacting transcriptional regulator [Parafilimonas sp.]
MENFYTAIALITAGASLAIGLVNIVIGVPKDGGKGDLVFGIMCLCMFIFFMIPPVGFILEDKAPYTLQIDIKRFFNFTFAALLPWFIALYTGSRKKIMPVVIDVFVALGYFAMLFTKTDSPKPAWVLFVLVFLGLNLGNAFFEGFMQIRKGEKSKGRWLIIALSFLAVLYMITAVNQLGNNYFGRMLGTKLFFPVNLFPLPFILIMGVRLSANVFEKYRLQKILNWGDIRWNSLVGNIQLFVIELDSKARIKFVNPYAVNALGYHAESELTGKNWYDLFVPKSESEIRKFNFRQIIEKGETQHFVHNIITKNGGELVVKWTNVFVYNNKSVISGLMSIGLNITEQEKAFEKVELLKTQLEKENLLFKEEQLSGQDEPGIVGKSESILYAVQKTRQVAVTNATVLLEGETGVGKELFATLIHKNSYRRDKAFIKVNCAALPPELIESELFGHEKGAFTGALQARKGRFELANGGTIFLDEVGEMPLSLQPKLLRVLQSGEFERIGGQETIKVDVRVISATNRELLSETAAGRFREDLYYRLNVFPITIPALRNRKEDIPLLVNYFVKKAAEEHKKVIENISKADMVRLTAHLWPGNIRELINLIERSVISSQGNTLKLDWLSNNTSAEKLVLHFSIEEVERNHILKVLNESNWKINGEDGAAAKLGLNPNTLRSRLKKLNISRGDA